MKLPKYQIERQVRLMYKIAHVAVEKTTYSFDLLFSYIIPSSMENMAKKGSRVIVPFGRGNKHRQGFIMDISDETKTKELKPLFLLIDEEPLLNSEMLAIITLLKDRTFCTYYDAFKAILPSGLSVAQRQLCTLAMDISNVDLNTEQEAVVLYLRKKKSPVPLEKLLEDFGILPDNKDLKELLAKGIIEINETLKQKIQDERLAMLRLCDNLTDEKKLALKLTKKQLSVVDFLEEIGFASVKEVIYFCAVGKQIVTKLAQKEVVEVYYKEVFRRPKAVEAYEKNNEEIILNQSQQQIFENINLHREQQNFGTDLIYGVTGSGKTVIFLKLIQKVVHDGKTAIMLVPEISLTPQMINTFLQKFGNEVAVLHSGLSLSERMDEWKRIKQGKAKVIVGTRSAIFAPCENLGMIIIDEEHESSYKSDKSPRYSAKEVAVWRCAMAKARLVLASATPSIESFYNAQIGKYSFHRLDERYSGGILPNVIIVDMREYYGNEKMFSDTLLAEIKANLDKKEQTILLMNRRGYNTLVRCSNCGETAMCPNCSVALTYHIANGRLICHHCGFQKNISDTCPTCGSDYVAYQGFGTQMVEEQISQIFPNASILRMDMDTTMSRYSHEEKFSDFYDGKYDIMIGTQMVAKGHNFPNVTLVGVIDADRMLFADDFRSGEKAFSLITQVIGRSGRFDKEGRAVIQTSYPQNDIILQAAQQDYISFYKSEIKMRKLFLYPPFCSIFLIGFTGINREHVQRASLRFAKLFVDTAKNKYSNLPVRLLGPCEPSIFKISGKYRYKILIKCKNNADMRKLVASCIEKFYNNKENRDVSVFADTYYDNIM